MHETAHHLYLEKAKDFNFILLSALLFTERDTSSFLGLNNHLNLAYQKYCKYKRDRKLARDSKGEKEKTKKVRVTLAKGKDKEGLKEIKEKKESAHAEKSSNSTEA